MKNKNRTNVECIFVIKQAVVFHQTTACFDKNDGSLFKNDRSFLDEQRVGQKVNPERVKNGNNFDVLTGVCDTCDSKKSTLLLEGARTHV